MKGLDLLLKYSLIILFLLSCITIEYDKVSDLKNISFEIKPPKSYQEEIDFHILSTEKLLSVKLLKTNTGIYINIDENYYTREFQEGLKVAIDYCRRYTGREFGVIFEVEEHGYILHGKSSSAMISLACIAMIMNKSIRNDTILTGEITNEGYIMPVEGIDEKIKIAEKFGYKKILIPFENIPSRNYSIKIIRVKHLNEALNNIL